MIEDNTLRAHGADYVINMRTYPLLLEYLLRLNYHLYMAKVALDHENQILLLLEVPTNLLDLPLFQLVTSTISTYIDRYGQEMLVMSLLEPDQLLSKVLALVRPGVAGERVNLSREETHGSTNTCN